MESAHTTSYQSLIVTMVLSCTVSEIRRIIGELLAENCVFLIPLSYLAPTLPMFPFEFRGAVWHGKTRVSGVSFTILASTVFVQSTRVTDVRPSVYNAVILALSIGVEY